ncbi:MAG: magnesium transporter MgtE N-terminal domain-containing protein, partial [Ignavibacterium sp.]
FASNDIIQTQESKQQKQDSTYQNWLKKVSKLLEQMEPAKASKIIQNYSDNVARDIIYSMNKKSAAKIVSELSPEVAQRIIRYD